MTAFGVRQTRAEGHGTEVAICPIAFAGTLRMDLLLPTSHMQKIPGSIFRNVITLNGDVAKKSSSRGAPERDSKLLF